jgi:hypothetical protein
MRPSCAPVSASGSHCGRLARIGFPRSSNRRDPSGSDFALSLLIGLDQLAQHVDAWGLSVGTRGGFVFKRQS